MNPEKLLAAVMLIALTFGAGLQVNWDHLVAILKNTSLIARALIANFLIVPLLGVALAKLFALPAPVATGFLLMAIAPGVPFVLASVRKRGGRLGLAVALALLLPALSILTIPVTAALVLPTAAQADLPMARFLLTLVLFQLLPLLAGIAVAGRAPASAAKLVRPVELIFFAAAIGLLAVLAPTMAHGIAAVYGSHGMLAMLCIVLLSFAVGWAMGGPAREDRRILGLGTALRNIGICALIAESAFPDKLIVATVLVYFIIQFVVTTIVGVYFARTVAKGA